VQYRYRPEVLQGLARHGIQPRPDTPPALVREFLNDVYRLEIRRLRDCLLRGAIAKPDYAGCVIALRQRYPLLSLPLTLWTED
jgi:hypothetical protein